MNFKLLDSIILVLVFFILEIAAFRVDIYLKYVFLILKEQTMLFILFSVIFI